MEMDSRTMQNTRLNRSYFISTPPSTAMMANTMEATPRSPAQDTTPTWPRDGRKGSSSRAATRGRPTRVRKAITDRAGSRTEGSSTGVTSRPSRKKMSTWATSVTTSKKWTK